MADLELAARQRPGLAVQRLAIELRIAGFLAHVPQRAVVLEPAEIVEVPVDPGVVGEAVLVDQRVPGEIDAGDPAILVVDRAQLDGQRGCRRRSTRCRRHRRPRALATMRTGRTSGAFSALASSALPAFSSAATVCVRRCLQRIVLDAGQAVGLQRVLLVCAQVQQQQRLRRRVVATDIGARLLRLGVAAVGDVMVDLRCLALV